MEEPTIFSMPEKLVIGMRLRMTLTEDRTSELWRGFLGRVGEIKGRIGSDRLSIQVFDGGKPYENFGPSVKFEKWAAVEVSSVDSVPEGMESRTLAGGEYAIFIHRGTPDMFFDTFQFIFSDWLPNSEFELDSRESFEVLGERYDPFDVNSEEEIWMPVRRRAD